MSDIIGNGYGDQHDWKKFETSQSHVPAYRGTLYSCKNCNASFRHYYHVIEDIFEAIKANGITDHCQMAENDRYK